MGGSAGTASLSVAGREPIVDWQTVYFFSAGRARPTFFVGGPEPGAVRVFLDATPGATVFAARFLVALRIVAVLFAILRLDLFAVFLAAALAGRFRVVLIADS